MTNQIGYISILIVSIFVLFIIVKEIIDSNQDDRISFWRIIPDKDPAAWYIMAGEVSSNGRYFKGVDGTTLWKNEYTFILIPYELAHESSFDDDDAIIRYSYSIYYRIINQSPTEEDT